MTYWVYIMASGDHGALYVGVTRDLQRRVEQHRAKEIAGFKVPREVHFVSAVTRAPSGKPDYRWAADTAAGDPDLLDELAAGTVLRSVLVP